MFSKNFFYRIRYQVHKKAISSVFYQFLLDKIRHPFIKNKKKRLKEEHRNYLKTKKTTKDYFSINAYYWNLIIHKNFKEFSYLEIGSWEGNSALYILKNFKTKKVFCVDTWDLNDNIYKEEEKAKFESFKSNLIEFKNCFIFFKSTSDSFFEKNKERFDVIYVDGWHEAPQVYKDINNAWDCLNIGGLMICDDYFYGNIMLNNDHNLPADAINQFLLERKNHLNIVCVNNMQIFIKKISN